MRLQRRPTGGLASAANPGARAIPGRTAPQQVLVSDELRAVALQDVARKGSPSDHKNALVVLLQFLHQSDEVTVTTHNGKSIDVMPGEGHFQRIESQVDVSAVLIAAWRHVALYHLD